MTKRNWVLLLLLVSVYPINELHTEFENSTLYFNSWLSGINYPFPMQWFVKFLCLDIGNIITAYIIFKLARMNSVLRIAAAVYLVLHILDLVFFFVDCNTGNYLLLYSFIGVFIIVIAYPKRMKYKKEYKPENTEKSLDGSLNSM
jgi:hypothetical protein